MDVKEYERQLIQSSLIIGSRIFKKQYLKEFEEHLKNLSLHTCKKLY